MTIGIHLRLPLQKYYVLIQIQAVYFKCGNKSLKSLRYLRVCILTFCLGKLIFLSVNNFAHTLMNRH